MEFSVVENLIIWVLPVLFAICLHEIAHGWVAYQLGDPTAKMLGRLSLNPLKHVDPLGTVLLPGLLLITGSPFLFGWAKPVPITWQNLKKPRRDMALVALAGPMANLLMALCWGAIASLSLHLGDNSANSAPLIFYMAIAGIQFNIVLMIFNLLPLPPLDGSRILSSLGTRGLRIFLSRLEPYGFIILLFLILTGAFRWLLLPLIKGAFNLVVTVFGIS
jgi:Zn-dependent protease